MSTITHQASGVSPSWLHLVDSDTPAYIRSDNPSHLQYTCRTELPPLGLLLQLLPGRISTAAGWREENLPEGQPFRHLSTDLGGRRSKKEATARQKAVPDLRLNRCQASRLEETPSGSSPGYHHPHSMIAAAWFCGDVLGRCSNDILDGILVQHTLDTQPG